MKHSFPIRWYYVWKPEQLRTEQEDKRQLLQTEKYSIFTKAILCVKRLHQWIDYYYLILILMGLLWLLSVAIVCHITQVTSAWPEKNSTVLKYSDEHISTTNSIPKESIVKITITTSNNVMNGTNSTDENSIREKRGTISDDRNLERRDSQKYRFSSWAGKRAEELENEKRAKFSSWGGKRAYDDLGDIYDSKRAKFSSWGGKRDYDTDNEDEMQKRAQFSSWAGKRDSDDIFEDKRTKFNSWAGKRASDVLDDKRAKFSSWAGKRGKFNSWAGKRSDLDPSEELIEDLSQDLNHNSDYFGEDKRAKFSSWAGKRSPEFNGSPWNKIPSENRMKYSMGGTGSDAMKLWQDFMSRKRARFSSWAGKRSEQPIAPEVETLMKMLDSETQDKRSKFSSWAGKRDDLEKRKFSSWGGKRDGNESSEEPIDEDKENYPSMIVKRSVYSWNGPSLAYKRKPIFSSWGGKRSDHTIQARSLPIQRVLMSGGHDRAWSSLLRPIRRGPDFYAWGGKRST